MNNSLIIVELDLPGTSAGVSWDGFWGLELLAATAKIQFGQQSIGKGQKGKMVRRKGLACIYGGLRNETLPKAEMEHGAQLYS